MSRVLAELSAPAAARALGPGSILLVPVGAIEQHGPHLPLATDAITADAVAEAAVERAAAEGVDVWRLPSMAVTKSDEHAWAAGTLSLRAETLLAALVDLGASVAATPARTLVFLNGHGGNTALLQIALRELRRRFGLRTFALDAGVQRAGRGAGGEPDELGMGIHGGFSETAVMLHLRPDLVDMSLASRAVPEHLASFSRIGFGGAPVAFGWLSDDFGGSGVIGDPTGATAEAGAELFAGGVGAAVAALREIVRFRHRPPGG